MHDRMRLEEIFVGKVRGDMNCVAGHFAEVLLKVQKARKPLMGLLTDTVRLAEDDRL